MQGGRSMHHLLCMWKNKTIQGFIGSSCMSNSFILSKLWVSLYWFNISRFISLYIHTETPCLDEASIWKLQFVALLKKCKSVWEFVIYCSRQCEEVITT